MLDILIPTFNRELFLGPCLKSLEEQTYKNFNVIVFDDGSTDNTKNIVDQFISHKILRIEYVKSIVNKGIGYARNCLLKLSVSDYAMWQDSDDLSAKNRVEFMLAYIASRSFDIVYSGIYSFIHPNMQRRSKRTVDLKKYTSRSGLFNNMNGPTAIFKKSIGQKYKFDESVTIGEDVLWITSMIKDHVKFGYCPSFLYYLRKHKDRTTFIYHNKK